MDQFVRANSTNLPKLDNISILEYMSNSDKHNIAEIRGAKALLSSRDAYVDTAVGYVEIKRTANDCIVRAKIVPEHRVSTKQYIVNAVINEKDSFLISTVCDGCAASAGGCKHSLVLLFWLEKRTNEPAPTSVKCYWKKPSLSNVRLDPIKSEDVFPKTKKIKLCPKDPAIRKGFLEAASENQVTKSLIISYATPTISYNIFDLTVEYLNITDNEDFQKYFEYLNTKITAEVVEEIKTKTVNQAESKMWHSMRQGRITASKIHEVSKCNTDGALVQQILGGYKVPETEAIKRGQRLEQIVFKEAEKQMNEKIQKSGFILINGILGASPDGIGKDFVIEIKCPSSKNTIKNYVANGVITNKCFAQMQLQMHATKKTRGVLCVADPEFEKNKTISLYWISYDKQFVNNLIHEATVFWEKYLFKKILLSAKV